MSIHNPDSLSDEQIGVAEGWRLLDEDEIMASSTGNPIRGLQSWMHEKWDGGGTAQCWRGNGKECTYRTRLSRADLAAARGLSQQPTREEGETPSATLHTLASKNSSTHSQAVASNAAPIVQSDAAAATPSHIAYLAATKIAQNTDAASAAAKGPRFMFVEYIEEQQGVVLAAINDATSQLRTELSAETARREEAERERDLLNGERDVFCEERTMLFSKIDNLRASLSTSEAEHRQTKDSLATLARQYVDSESQREEAEKKRDEMKDAISAAEKLQHGASGMCCQLRLQALAERDDAVVQRAQAEAKVREQHEQICVLQSQVDNAGANLEQVRSCAKFNYGKTVTELESALTTERHAREQAETQAAVIRGLLDTHISDWDDSLIQVNKLSDPVLRKKVSSRVEKLRAALAADSGKPLLARLEKAEADVRRLDWLQNNHPATMRSLLFQATKGLANGATFRDAIDAAMSATTEEGR